MAKQITEDELNLRRKSRRRLIGAIILTLAVVVILPMVLDSEPRSSGQDIDLRIPDPDKAGEFVPVVPASKAPKQAPGEASTGAATTAADKPAAEQTGTAKSTAEPDKQAVVAPSTKKDTSGKALSTAEKTSSTVTSKPVVTEGFVAQVGAYSNAATAKQELNKLKKWGFKAYTEMTGDKVRVRVGPFSDREKAEQARRQLEKRGLKPVVMSTK